LFPEHPAAHSPSTREWKGFFYLKKMFEFSFANFAAVLSVLCGLWFFDGLTEAGEKKPKSEDLGM